MSRLLARLLARWGSTVEMVDKDGTAAFSAVLQPAASVSWQNMRRQMNLLGEIPTGQYVYVGGRDIGEASFLRCGGRVYLPRRCEAICLGDRVLCWWGLCVPAGEEAAWIR